MIERFPLSRELSREVDRLAIEQYGMCGLVLMENAGRGCTEILLRRGVKKQGAKKVVILCGGGNNGGDGLVIARHLQLHDVPTELVLLKGPSELKGEALENFRIVERAGIGYRVFERDDDIAAYDAIWEGADWVVDAMLGTGTTGDPRPPVSDWIEAVNQRGMNVLAIDLPSGLDCQTGQPGRPTIRATVTATFVAPKIGFFEPVAKDYLGELEVVDIGVPKALLEEVFAQAKKAPT